MMNGVLINVILNAIEMLVRQVTWKIDPFSEDQEDLKDADFIRRNLFG